MKVCNARVNKKWTQKFLLENLKREVNNKIKVRGMSFEDMNSTELAQDKI
jgi:hypothetical protein